MKELFKKKSAISKEFYVLFVLTGFLDLIFLFEEYFGFRFPQMAIYVYYAILFLIDIFSTFFYIALLVFIIKELFKKKSAISKEFYVLFVLTGFLDLIFLFEEYFGFRFPQMGFFQHFYMDYLLTTSIFTWCLTYSLAQVILTASFGITASFNRLSCIYWPMYYPKLWSSWRLFLLLAWPFPIITVYFIHFVQYPTTFALDDEDGVMVGSYADPIPTFQSWFIVFLSHILTLILVAILNFLLIRKLKKVSIVESLASQVSKTEITLSKFAQVYFVIILICVVDELILCIANEFGWIAAYKYGMTFYMAVESLIIFFPPYTLMIISNDVRKMFFVFIGLRKNDLTVPKITIRVTKTVI
uniref:Serpentine receptor class gamma n=1 Tax=Rhabditophanes sp. KR3021 TaxID=114890 RepID=A0AC35TY79_9BILA